MTFKEWFHDYEWSPEKEAWGQSVWNAAQQAERERIRARVMQAAVKSWHGYDLTIGVPYVRLKAFTDALLEDE